MSQISFLEELGDVGLVYLLCRFFFFSSLRKQHFTIRRWKLEHLAQFIQFSYPFELKSGPWVPSSFWFVFPYHPAQDLIIWKEGEDMFFIENEINHPKMFYWLWWFFLCIFRCFDADLWKEKKLETTLKLFKVF